jgi:mannose-6-phosphate isomerase-like protein (cupin superfamily)
MSKTVEKEIITEYRPWGYFCVLEEQETYKVKKLVVKPNQRLSLQLHHHRDEQWIIVSGNALFRIGDNTKEYMQGDCATILRGQLHRIENNRLEEVIIIEVQNGEYLGENDIVRFEDDYLRVY